MPFTGSKTAKYGSADMPLYIPEQLGRIYDERKVSNSKAKAFANSCKMQKRNNAHPGDASRKETPHGKIL